MSEERTLQLQIDRFSEFIAEKQQRLSAPTYIFGLPWKIEAYPRSIYDTLVFNLRCNEEDDDPSWSCRASAKLQIVSQKTGVRDVTSHFDHTFSLKQAYCGYFDIVRYYELLDPKKGFIKDDIVILRAHVKAEMPQTPQMDKLLAFASSISDPPDGTLIVGKNKIAIHKMYLSYYSDYFKTMFRSEFKEGREDEIVLEDVGHKEILQLLSVIYPSSAPITEKNLKIILKLADRFIMPAVLEQCKNALGTTNLNGAQKLLLAQQYNFKDLLKELVQQCKTVEDAKKLKAEPEYQMLDSETHLLILDSITS